MVDPTFIPYTVDWGVWGLVLEQKQVSTWDLHFAGQDVNLDAATTNQVVDNTAKDTIIRMPGYPTARIPPPKVVPERKEANIMGFSKGMVSHQFVSGQNTELKYGELLAESAWPLYLAMGSANNVTTGTYHYLTIAPGGVRPSFTDWYQINNVRATQSKSFKTVGCQVNKLTMKGDASQHITYDLDVKGARTVTSTSDLLDTLNYPLIGDANYFGLLQPYTNGMCSISAVDQATSATIGDIDLTPAAQNVKAFELMNWELSIENNLKPVQSGGVNWPYWISNRLATAPKVTYKAKFVTSDDDLIDWWNSYIYKGSITTETKFTHSISRSASDYIQLVFNRIKITELDPADEDGLLTLEATFTGSDEQNKTLPYAATDAEYGFYVIAKDVIDKIGTIAVPATAIWHPYGTPLA